MAKPVLGIIKSYDSRPGYQYGRIFVEGNRRPVHFDIANCEIEEPKAGMKVVFHRKRDRAVDVRLLDKPEPAPAGQEA
jgi:hypothetical protein